MAATNRRAGEKMTATTSEWRNKLPDGSKSVQSVWVWRGFFFLSLIALGLAIKFTEQDLRFYSIAWFVIAAGWFAVSMWLWRKHVRDDNEASQQQLQQSGQKSAVRASQKGSAPVKGRGRTR